MRDEEEEEEEDEEKEEEKQDEKQQKERHSRRETSVEDISCNKSEGQQLGLRLPWCRCWPRGREGKEGKSSDGIRRTMSHEDNE